jgi:hypothetical protein
VTPDGSVLFFASAEGMDAHFNRRSWVARCDRGGEPLTVYGTLTEAFDRAAEHFGCEVDEIVIVPIDDAAGRRA